MKRSVTKSLKRRIEESSSAILQIVQDEHSRRLMDVSAAAVDTTIRRLQTHFKRFACLLLGLFVLCCLCLFATSCNVTRTVTNHSEFYQRGDTSVVIQTKTIETYDASKKL